MTLKEYNAQVRVLEWLISQCEDIFVAAWLILKLDALKKAKGIR